MSAGRSPSDAILSDDTARAAEDEQIRIWRALSTLKIAQVVQGASNAARTLAFAGLRDRYPNASERELVARFAAMTMGVSLARQAYPELDHLDL